MSALLMLAMIVGDDAVELVRRTTALTVPRAGCTVEAQPGEVVVCARRRADRYRLPLREGDGGTRRDPTPDQRVAALAPPNNCEAKGAFLVGCGHVGVGVGLGGGGARLMLRERTPDVAD